MPKACAVAVRPPPCINPHVQAPRQYKIVRRTASTHCAVSQVTTAHSAAGARRHVRPASLNATYRRPASGAVNMNVCSKRALSSWRIPSMTHGMHQLCSQPKQDTDCHTCSSCDLGPYRGAATLRAGRVDAWSTPLAVDRRPTSTTALLNMAHSDGGRERPANSTGQGRTRGHVTTIRRPYVRDAMPQSDDGGHRHT